MRRSPRLSVVALTLVIVAMGFNMVNATNQEPAWMKASMENLEKELVAKYGDGQRSRLQKGLKQVAAEG